MLDLGIVLAERARRDEAMRMLNRVAGRRGDPVPARARSELAKLGN